MKAVQISEYPKFPIICEPRAVWSQIYTGLKGSHQPEFVIDLKLEVQGYLFMIVDDTPGTRWEQ